MSRYILAFVVLDVAHAGFQLVSIHSTPQLCGDDQVCRRAMFYHAPDGACQILRADDPTPYSKIFRACATKRIFRQPCGNFNFY